MKDKLKLFFRWTVIFILSFIVIYLVVFFGGWKLFESGNPILIEIGCAIILSIFVFLFSEKTTGFEKRIELLEKRINELENKQ